VALNESDLSDLLAALRAGDMTDTVRTSVEWVLQQLIEAEATAVIGARPHERSELRVTQRNGHRPKLVSTAAGDVELAIPKLREGSFFPSLLERRRRIDRALFAVVMEAYVHGVSTRKVDDLVKALGVGSGISRSEVSRICAELDRDLDAFRNRRLDHTAFPYVFADATYLKGRVRGRVVSRAVVVATGVRADGDREVLGVEVGDSEDQAFWAAFFKGLRARGLGGVQLVISDHHLGLKAAIESVFIGAAWQRCRVHFMRNLLARVPKGSAEMVAATVRTVFAQPDAAHVRSPACSKASSPTSPPCSATPPKTCSPSPASPSPTGARSGPPTPSNASTARSNAAPKSSGYSPTTRRSPASSPPWSLRPTTNGPSPSAATSPKAPWPNSTPTNHQPTPTNHSPSPHRPN